MKRKLLPVLFAVVLAGMGCVSQPTRRLLLSPDEWEQAIAGRGVSPDFFANPTEVSAELEKAAREFAGAGDDLTRLERLQQTLFDPKIFTFEYDYQRTLTAKEAFDERRGNCISFVNLFIAMARSLGIPVRPAMVRAVTDVETEGDLVVVSTHLVAVYEHPSDFRVFDFYQFRQGTAGRSIRRLDDFWLNALYLNNLGVEKLRDGSVGESMDYFEAAIKLAPEFAECYGNLGVARRRAGDPQGALATYLAGLEVSPDNPRIVNNLRSLYLFDRSGGSPLPVSAIDEEEADFYVLMVRADLEFTRGRPARALPLYKRAHRLKPEDPEPLVSLARVEMHRGRRAVARNHLERAVALDGSHEAALRLLALLEAAPED